MIWSENRVNDCRAGGQRSYGGTGACWAPPDVSLASLMTNWSSGAGGGSPSFWRVTPQLRGPACATLQPTKKRYVPQNVEAFISPFSLLISILC